MLFLNLASVKIDDDSLDSALYRVADGDSGALGEVYDAVHKSVYAYAFSKMKNKHDAEDILQDLFIILWKSAKEYKSMDKPMAWIMTLVRNLCYMKLRSRQRASFIPIEDIINTDMGNVDTEAENSLIIKECLSALSDSEREIVVLHAVSGFKHREIAAMLKMPLATVLSKYSRGIKKMQKFMSEGEAE